MIEFILNAVKVISKWNTNIFVTSCSGLSESGELGGYNNANNAKIIR